MMRGPVRILSDLHLGHRGSRVESAEQLAPLLEGVGTLVSNGDTWEQLAIRFRERGRQLLDDWRGMMAERGVEFLALPGNHDPGSGEGGYLELQDGAVFVSHGDGVFAESAPWHRMVPKRRGEIAEAFRRAGKDVDDLDGRLRLAGEVARLLVTEKMRGSRAFLARCWDAAVPPDRAVRMILAWATFPDEAAAFLERYRPRARVFICGHFHRTGVWQRRDRLIVNTGSFRPPGQAWHVDLDGEWMSVGKIVEDGDRFRPGERVGLWRIRSDQASR